MTAAELRAAWRARGFELSFHEAEELHARLTAGRVLDLYVTCLAASVAARQNRLARRAARAARSRRERLEAEYRKEST